MAPHAVIAGGAGATLSLDQVLAVVHGAQVVLDSAASQRVKKESPPPKSFQPEQPPAEAPPCSSALDRQQCRAALFYKLLALINGKSGVRLAVVEALAALLNSSATPVLPAADADAAPLASLAAFLQGVGAAASADGAQQTAADALAAAGVEAPGLSAAERALVQDGQSVSAGTAAICVQAGKLLLAVANAAAALSAEALQADVSGQGGMLRVSLVRLPGGWGQLLRTSSAEHSCCMWVALRGLHSRMGRRLAEHASGPRRAASQAATRSPPCSRLCRGWSPSSADSGPGAGAAAVLSCPGRPHQAACVPACPLPSAPCPAGQGPGC